MSTDPAADRPYMPGYGIEPAHGGAGEMLPWSWAEQRLVESHTFWLATHRHARLGDLACRRAVVQQQQSIAESAQPGE